MKIGEDAASSATENRAPDKHRPNFLWVAVVFSAAIIALCFQLTREMGVLATYILLLCFALAALPRKHTAIACVCWGGIGLFLALAGYGSQYWVGIRNRNIELLQNMEAIELAVERYASDYGYYPDTIEALVYDAYLPTLPKNPFTKEEAQPCDTSLDAPGRMHLLGHTDIPRNPVELIGHFMYIPQFEKVGGEIVAVDYTLIGYGKYFPGVIRGMLLQENTAEPIYYRPSKHSSAVRKQPEPAQQ